MAKKSKPKARKSKSSSWHQVLSCADDFASDSADTILLVGRVLLGFLLLASGWGKIGFR